MDTVTHWRDSGIATDKQMQFIAREAFKTRLKEGWSPAYEFLGYSSEAPVDVSPLRLERTQIPVGDTLVFTVDLTAAESLPVHVTYVITSTTPRGGRREKVYHLSRATTTSGQLLSLVKVHRMRTTATTTVTPGLHSVAIQVNGTRYPGAEFRV
ncbi:hypothetical protein, partial [Longispora fulva]